MSEYTTSISKDDYETIVSEPIFVDRWDGKIEDNLSYKIKEIEKEYENQLQRQKIHISRGNRITGRRIHGRRYKVTISKGLFRNKKGIVSCPSKS